ncbi:unnamed protein product [Medioppia subpectinata]|jgi:hypothetical protein
MATK